MKRDSFDYEAQEQARRDGRGPSDGSWWRFTINCIVFFAIAKFVLWNVPTVQLLAGAVLFALLAAIFVDRGP
jgi:hypothetical protein